MTLGNSPAEYRCIVADPPWRVSAGRALGAYQHDGTKQLFTDAATVNARKLAYPSMTVAEICALKVPAASSAHLYLWTINAYLRDSFTVMDAWGFKFSTMLVWAKTPFGGGLGGCYGLATEYCLFGYRGRQDAKTRIGRNWWNWRRPYDDRGKPKHSAKPSEFYEMVEGMSPGPYLEMFCRTPREGWHVWGNEVTSDVEISA